MRRVAGIVLAFAGGALALFSLVAGSAFSVILLMGFLGTGGREAGDQLAFMLVSTVLGFAIGYAIMKAGRWLARGERPSA